MFNEKDFKEHLETLSKEELINLTLFWRKKGSEYYHKLYRPKPKKPRTSC